jgi:hypothetical protein
MDVIAERVARTFEERFARWGLHLPDAAIAARRSGDLAAEGWRVGWRWGEMDGVEYLEYLATHRTVGAEHARVWATGRFESPPAPYAPRVMHS